MVVESLDSEGVADRDHLLAELQRGGSVPESSCEVALCVTFVEESLDQAPQPCRLNVGMIGSLRSADIENFSSGAGADVRFLPGPDRAQRGLGDIGSVVNGSAADASP